METDGGGKEVTETAESICVRFLIPLFFRNIDYETVERLSNLFDKDVNEAVKIVLALPDGDLKHDLIHVNNSFLCYQIWCIKMFLIN